MKPPSLPDRIVWADLSTLQKADLLRWCKEECANLTRANLTRADLTRADLTRADLADANLADANLAGANLTGANLTRANLTRANLTRADLTRADLTGTCLGQYETHRLISRQLQIVGKHGGRIAYRTARSLHVRDTEYIPGNTYIAPVLSFSHETDCHPGIYACPMASDPLLEGESVVRVYIRDGDWTTCIKGIRCKRIRVLGYV